MPYFPYVAKTQGKRSTGKGGQERGDKTSSFMKREIEDRDGVQAAVYYHTSHRYYEFTLSDTNLLHRSGFTDSPHHKVPYQPNHRVLRRDGSSIDDIVVSRIDVYRLFDGTREIEELVAGTDWKEKGKIIAV